MPVKMRVHSCRDCHAGPAQQQLSPEAQAFLQQSAHFLHFLRDMRLRRDHPAVLLMQGGLLNDGPFAHHVTGCVDGVLRGRMWGRKCWRWWHLRPFACFRQRSSIC